MASRYARRVTTVAALVFLLTEGRASSDLPEQPRSHGPEGWPRVHVPDPIARLSVHAALDDAWRALGSGECRTLLGEFRDRSGCPLERRLSALSVDPQAYLALLLFVDGSRDAACGDGVFAFTAPGSRVVRLCLGEVKRTAALNPRHAAAYFIHEMLHTLGLSENPPSSREINRRVLAACAREEWRRTLSAEHRER